MIVAEKHQAGLKRAVALGLGPAILLLLTTGFYWKLTATDQYTWLDSPDLAFQVLPWWNYQAREWHAGRFPAWEPNAWGGQPLVGQVQPGAAYPLNWVLFATPLRDGKLRMGFLHLYFVFYHWLAALNAYLFCRYLCRSRGAAILGGCIFAFGAAVGNIDWPQMVNGAIWMPLVFLNLLRVHDDPERSKLHAAWAGAWLGLAWLAGHHQIPTFVTYGALFTWAWITWERGWRMALRPFLLFVAMLGLISGLQTVPAAEYAPLARRWVGMAEAVDWKTKVSYHVHEMYALLPMTLLGTFVAGINRAFAPFVGVVALTFAGLGLATGWRREARFRWLGGLGIFALLIALAKYSLLHGMLYAWAPLVEKSRSPGMAVALFGFVCAALAAAGVDRLRLAERWLVPARRILLGLATLVMGLFLVMALVRGQDSIGDERPMMAAVAALLLAGLLTWHRTGELALKHLAIAAVALTLLEQSNSSGFDFPNVNRPRDERILVQTREHDDVAAYLKSLTEPVRVEVDDQVVQYNFGDWHGISHFGGYLASLTSNLLAVDARGETGREIFGVTHWVGKAPRNGQETLVFQGRAGVNVYRRAGMHPRAWTVHTILPVDRNGLRAAIDLTKPHQIRQAVTLVEPVKPLPFPSAACSEDVVRLRNYEPSRVVVNAKMTCPGVLILGDTNYPGWQVRVDGVEKPLLVPFGVVRGVTLEAGEHNVEFRYQPKSLWVGAAMSLSGLLLLAAVTYGARRSAK